MSMQSTLVLNASYEPLNIVSAQKAVTRILQGKVVSVDDSPRFVRSEGLVVPIPYVVQHVKQVARPKGVKNRDVPFSRRGVLVRDGFKCAYCGKLATTIDHVLPRALGGVTSWKNCVAACERCNSKKGHIPLERLGWTLHVTPATPTWEDVERAKSREPWYFQAVNRAPSGSAHRKSWERHIALYDPRFALTLV